jgi:hypothetical protein
MVKLEEIVQLSGAGAFPFVAISVPISIPLRVKVKSNEAGTKTPVPPVSKVRCAAPQLLALACSLVPGAMKVPLGPFSQVNVPVVELGPFDGEAPAADAPRTSAPEAGIKHAAARRPRFQRRICLSPLL